MNTAQTQQQSENAMAGAHLSTDALRNICHTDLERGEIWRPWVVAEPKNGVWFWRDKEESGGVDRGPFASERAALLDAIKVNGVEDESILVAAPNDADTRPGAAGSDLWRVQMLGCGTVAAQFDFGTEQQAVAHARHLASFSVATEVASEADVVRFEASTVTVRAFQVVDHPDETKSPSYRSVMATLENEVARIDKIREETGLGDYHLVPAPWSAAPIVQAGRFAVLFDRQAIVGLLENRVVHIGSVSPTGKSVVLDQPEWRTGDRVKLRDVAATFATYGEAQAAIDFCKQTAAMLRYVEKARSVALVEMFYRAAQQPAATPAA